MLIDGAWVDSISGRVLSVENPAKRCAIAEVPRGDTADVNAPSRLPPEPSGLEQSPRATAAACCCR
jgi:hypothetical protein